MNNISIMKCEMIHNLHSTALIPCILVCVCVCERERERERERDGGYYQCFQANRKTEFDCPWL